jgi:hypothetical protein
LIYESGFNTPVSGWKRCLDPLNVEKEMTRICVEFLCFKDVQSISRSLVDRFERHQNIAEDPDEQNEVESFAMYSAEYWHGHLRSSNMSVQDSLFDKTFQCMILPVISTVIGSEFIGENSEIGRKPRR